MAFAKRRPQERNRINQPAALGGSALALLFGGRPITAAPQNLLSLSPVVHRIRSDHSRSVICSDAIQHGTASHSVLWILAMLAAGTPARHTKLTRHAFSANTFLASMHTEHINRSGNSLKSFHADHCPQLLLRTCRHGGAYAVVRELCLPFLLCSAEALLAASPSSLTT